MSFGAFGAVSLSLPMSVNFYLLSSLILRVASLCRIGRLGDSGRDREEREYMQRQLPPRSVRWAVMYLTAINMVLQLFTPHGQSDLK
jgi:hypothetical protein